MSDDNNQNEEVVEEEVEETEEVQEDEEEVVEEEEEHEDTVPYDRFSEKSAEIDSLKQQVELLVMQSQQQAPTQNQASPESYIDALDIEPEMKQSLKDAFNVQAQQSNQILGNLLDQVDALSAEVKLDKKAYKENKTAIELIRTQYANQNRYVSREEAFNHLVQTGKIKHDTPATKKKKVVKMKKKSPTKVVSEKPNAPKQSAKSSGKVERGMSVADMEKNLEVQTF